MSVSGTANNSYVVGVSGNGGTGVNRYGTVGVYGEGDKEYGWSFRGGYSD
jgi:hypothetical protein